MNAKDNEIIDLINDHASLIPCCFPKSMNVTYSFIIM